MVTLLLIVMLAVILLTVLLMAVGVFTVSFGWVILIIADIAIAVLVIKGLIKLFSRKKKK